MSEKRRRCSAAFDYGAVRRKAATQDCDAALGGERGVKRGDDATVANLRRGEAVGQRTPGDSQRRDVQQRLELLEQRLHAARVMEVLDQELAGRPQVRKDRRAARDLVEAIEGQRHAYPAGEGEQVDDGIRGAADRLQHGDRVVERIGGEDLRGPQVLVRQLDGTPACRLCGAVPRRIDRRDRRRSGKAHPQRFDQACQRRGGAHLVAMAV